MGAAPSSHSDLIRDDTPACDLPESLPSLPRLDQAGFPVLTPDLRKRIATFLLDDKVRFTGKFKSGETVPAFVKCVIRCAHKDGADDNPRSVNGRACCKVGNLSLLDIGCRALFATAPQVGFICDDLSPSTQTVRVATMAAGGPTLVPCLSSLASFANSPSPLLLR